jgi:L-rhamnose-H+ transport protein
VNLSEFIGILAAVVSGILNGSFAAPMKLNKKWEWENTWILYAVSALIIFPFILIWITVPDLLLIYQNVQNSVLIRTFLFGLGWGVGSLLFGLGLYLVGLSLGYTIIMGLIAVTGALVPMMVHYPESLFTAGGGVIVLAMFVTAAGVTLCGLAGMIRDKNQQENKNNKEKRINFKLGFLICLASGMFSAMLNLAFSFGAPIAEAAIRHMGEFSTAFKANNAIWFLALIGGSIPFLIYCGWLLLSKQSYKKYIEPGTGLYWLWSFLMGTMWISCIVLYGIGASQLGKLGTTIGWLILMAVTVLVGNLWGILSGEWKGSPAKARLRMGQGLSLLIGSVLLVGVGKILLS